MATKFPETPEDLEEAGYEPGNVSTCRGCGQKIQWWKTPKGKNIPLDVDCKPHWATCPEAESFRR